MKQNNHRGPVLSVIVPAFNEEASVERLAMNLRLVQCQLLRHTPVAEVEFVLVNDGSSDRTAALMEKYRGEFVLVHHPHNQGYGAALQSGFAAARGEILGFLDCDGTCNPHSFVGLCQRLWNEGADMVVGNRMERSRSRMPLQRYLGNWVYAKLLSFLSGRKISDTASGMRVFRRELLDKVMPLPRDLNFTPAMTARALHEQLRVAEAPIDYREREGSSKLSLVKHGVTFLGAILETVLLYDPLKIFSGVALGILVVAAALIAYPFYSYFTFQETPFGYYIYRSIIALALSLMALQIFLFGVLGGFFVDLFVNAYNQRKRTYRFAHSLGFFTRLTWYGSLAVILAGFVIVLYAWQYFFEMEIQLHWSWLLAASGLMIAGVQTLSAGLLMDVMRLNKRGQG